MADIRVDVLGLKELNKKLYEMRDKVAEKTARRAVYAGAKVLRDKMRAKAPAATDTAAPGELKKSISISTRVRRSEGKIVASVGPKGRKNTKRVKGEKTRLDHGRNNPTPRSEARWLEFGVKPHKIPNPDSRYQSKKRREQIALKLKNGDIRSQVDHPGFAPKPFIRPTADEGFAPAVDAFTTELKAGIDKITNS